MAQMEIPHPHRMGKSVLFQWEFTSDLVRCSRVFAARVCRHRHTAVQPCNFPRTRKYDISRTNHVIMRYFKHLLFIRWVVVWAWLRHRSMCAAFNCVRARAEYRWLWLDHFPLPLLASTATVPDEKVITHNNQTHKLLTISSQFSQWLWPPKQNSGANWNSLIIYLLIFNEFSHLGAAGQHCSLSACNSIDRM